MQNSVFLFTSFQDKETLVKSLSNFQIQDHGDTITIPSHEVEITSDDGYFNEQHNGMFNFYSSVLNENNKDVVNKFLMHLKSCVKGYKVLFNNNDLITPVTNALIEGTSGLIFSANMSFYYTNWKTIIDAEGNSNVVDYTVKMSAETFDADIVETKASLARKQRSIAILKSKQIKYIDGLPTIPDSTQIINREAADIAKRIIILGAVSVKGELRSSDIPFQILEKYNINPDDVSPYERHILQSKDLEDQDYVNAIWRYESLNVLMWASGYVDKLYFPSDIVQVTSITTPIRESTDFSGFKQKLNMRSKDEILDQLDLIYRLHWACVDARINNQPPLNGVNQSVVYERHYALNWLINRYNEAWDNVSTPT